jgi:hypothetical protein
LLNRCLASHPQLMVFSEVNPVKSAGGGVTGISRQSQEWYGISIKPSDFIQELSDALHNARQLNRAVIVRDWTYVDFPLESDIKCEVPAKQFSTLNVLRASGIPTKPFAFVRNAVDIWLSKGGDIKDFARVYRQYVERLIEENIPYFRYEDLCHHGELTLRAICAWNKVKFHEQTLNFASEQRVNGDIALGSSSRGFTENQFVKLNRKPATPQAIEQIRSSKDLRWANEALGYSTNYDDLPKDSLLSRISRRIRRQIRGRRLRRS